MAMSAFYNHSRILQYLFTDYPIYAEPRHPDFYHGLIGELMEEARRRNSISPETIHQVEEQYSRLPRPEGTKVIGQSRAVMEKRFRDTVLQLEDQIRRQLPWSQTEPDRRTLGSLIHEAEERKFLGRIRLRELWFVNEVRIALNHPTTETVSDEDLVRATESARAGIQAVVT